jgi:hypothetical protein
MRHGRQGPVSIPGSLTSKVVMGEAVGFLRERSMRKLLVLGSFSLVFAFSLSAHQHAAAPAAAPAPVVAHAAAAPAPTHAASPSKPSSSTTHSSLAASKSTSANHANSIPRPTPIIVPPVSSITTTTSCPKHVGSAGYNTGCAPPVSGVGGSALYGGAYYIPVPYYYGDAAAPEELPPGPGPGGPQDVDAMAGGPMVGSDPAGGRPLDQPDDAPVAAPSPSEINKALAEFVFVNRDGTKFNAVAYSFVNDKLQYVTKEGVRHSEAIDSLDLDATQKINEQLGNTINLPGLPASGVAQAVPASTLQ